MTHLEIMYKKEKSSSTNISVSGGKAENRNYYAKERISNSIAQDHN